MLRVSLVFNKSLSKTGFWQPFTTTISDITTTVLCIADGASQGIVS